MLTLPALIACTSLALRRVVTTPRVSPGARKLGEALESMLTQRERFRKTLLLRACESDRGAEAEPGGGPSRRRWIRAGLRGSPKEEPTRAQWKSRLPGLGGAVEILGIQKLSAITCETPSSTSIVPETPRKSAVLIQAA